MLGLVLLDTEFHDATDQGALDGVGFEQDEGAFHFAGLHFRGMGACARM